MEQPQNGPGPSHWSMHPWKLAGVLAGAIVVLATASLELTLLLLGRLAASADATGQVAWSILPTLLRAAAYVLLGGIVLRAQRRQGLADRAQNRIGWAALPGLLVLAAFLANIVLWVPAADIPAFYRWNSISATLGSLVSAALPVLLAALLLPALYPKTGGTVGALVIAAVLFVPSLAQQALLTLHGYETQLWTWVVLQPLQTLSYALVAAALSVAVRRRLWDALALQWGLLCLLGWLASLWRPDMVGAVPAWLGDTHRLILWSVPALASLYCLLLWDRGISLTWPFVVFAHRIKALADRHLPL